MGEKKGRRSRLDKGVIRTKLRDIDLLRFIGDQQAVSRQVLIWLCTTKSDAAQSWLNRMDALGCVGMEDVTTAKKAQRYIWATRAGLKKGELPYKTRRSKQFQHANAVAMARIWLQGFDDALAHPEDWESERAQRHIIAREGNDHAGVHVPDGIYRKNIAVECELSAKGVDATVAIMEQLLNEYRYVVYIVSHEAAKKVQQAVEKGGVYICIGSVTDSCVSSVRHPEDIGAPPYRTQNHSSSGASPTSISFDTAATPVSATDTCTV